MFIYEIIAGEIGAAIASGQLPPGSRIASIRECSERHSVSVNTIKAAYRILEDRGLITARPQSGYFVNSKISELSVPAAVVEDKEKIPLNGINKLLAFILGKCADEQYVDFALAYPVGENYYPSSRLKKLTSQVLRSKKSSIGSYVLPPGSLRLRSQIARRGLQMGMSLSAEDILLTHGAMEAINLAVRATTRPGDGVAIETPTFYNLYPMLEDAGRRIIEIPTHPRTGMCLDTLQNKISLNQVAAVLTIPSGHNPLGFTMPVENRQRLAHMANVNQVAVIEDAIYSELQYTPQTIPNIKSFDEDGWVLVCASYTKIVAPDFRIGWLDAGRFRDVARQLKFTSTVAEPEMLAETLGLFLENGSYDLHLRHLKRLYSKKIDAVRALIEQYFPLGTRVSRPECGFILWIELPEGSDTLRLFHDALEEKIICMPGALCSGNKSFNHCLRLAVCFDFDDRRIHALRRLGQLADEQLQAR